MAEGVVEAVLGIETETETETKTEIEIEIETEIEMGVGVGYFKFERLDVWKRGIAWADKVFDIAEVLPQKYQFSLGEQMRRAALSIPTNIAEGTGRNHSVSISVSV